MRTRKLIETFKAFLNEEDNVLVASRYSVIGMNLKRNEKEGIGIVWDKDFDDPREAMKYAQEKGKEEPQHVVELIDTITDKILYNSQEKSESVNEDVKYSNEYVDDLLSFSDHDELIKSESDFEDYLCYKEGKGYCVTSITYEYEKPQINFQTEWFETKEKALDSYKKDFLGESLNEGKQFYLGWRGNPQLAKGGYYKAYGQLSKKEAKDKEDCLYGSMTLTAYDSEDEYNQAIEKAKNDGFRVN